MSEPLWEPWRPKVGDRVRVRLSGECRLTPHAKSLARRLGFTTHHPTEDGATGVVIATDHQTSDGWRLAGHPYRVRFDWPSPVIVEAPAVRYVIGMCEYAAIELEKTDDLR